jgi:ABC-type transport system involved in multi-copper enzyme maturation permease subunit
MNRRIASIASNTFREAVRDRVLYNLIAFALLMSGAAILVGQISIDIERLVVINLGLTAVSLFGIVIAIFIGIGLVSKEIEKRTLYTVLSRPVRRFLWQSACLQPCSMFRTSFSAQTDGCWSPCISLFSNS